MASSSENGDSGIPTLPSRHSGIPSYLLSKAHRTKAAILEGSTDKPHSSDSEVRREVAIPQGIEKDAFFQALEKLKTTLGEANVEVNGGKLVDGWYMEHPNTHDMMTLLGSEEFAASAVVYPSSTEEVQSIVRWANEHLVPIWPISMGRNLGYGGAAPRVRGSVVIDLGRRMNKILDMNKDDYTCLVEPGVSYYALYEAIEKRGLREHMWIDTPDLGGGSIIGNAMDRGVGYTPYGDHWGAHSGLEVVLPTGEVVRTGMGAMKGGEKTWGTFPYGFGPYLDGIFSQSNFGIVTKMGMTLMPNPGGYESFMYTFPRDEDLAQIIDIIRPLRIRNVLENVAQVRHVLQSLAIRGEPRTKWYAESGPFPDDILHEAAAALPTGDYTWAYYGMAYGPQDIRERKLSIIDAEFRRVPGARKIDPKTLPDDEYFWSRDKIAAGIPELHELNWCNWVPNGSHVAFSPVSPIRGTDALALLDIARSRHQEFNIDLFPAFLMGVREMHLIIEIVFDRRNPESRKAVMKCLRAMVSDAAKLGYGEYRTHLALMDQIAGTYNWGDGALGRLNERLKDALDPKGIMAPGRCGVWPERYRGRGWEMLGEDQEGEERSEGNGVGDAKHLKLTN
ncbi:hypothetical protein BJ170DRAFT_314997 [Xylariales sp. AK1849]|nr:hypothetical protein BJ170DRAFT_314997 [Xylariales sp. AK1849]